MKTTEQRLQPLKNGDISSYCLLCGYVQKQETTKRWKKIFMEHSGFHVMTGIVCFNLDKTVYHAPFDLWETFENNELTKARKLYHSIK